MRGLIFILAIVVANATNETEAEKDVRLTNAAMLAATNSNDAALVKKILDSGQAPDAAVSGQGLTPLLSAANYGHCDVIETLIDNGASVHKPSSDGVSPIWAASKQGHVRAVETLLRRGANAKDEATGFSALLIASIEGHADVAEKLVAAGAEVDKPKTDGGFTPLYVAAQEGHVWVVDKLLKGGATVDKTSPQGVTPLLMAISRGHAPVVDRLLGARPINTQQLHTLVVARALTADCTHDGLARARECAYVDVRSRRCEYCDRRPGEGPLSAREGQGGVGKRATWLRRDKNAVQDCGDSTRGHRARACKGREEVP